MYNCWVHIDIFYLLRNLMRIREILPWVRITRRALRLRRERYQIYVAHRENRRRSEPWWTWWLSAAVAWVFRVSFDLGVPSFEVKAKKKKSFLSIYRFQFRNFVLNFRLFFPFSFLFLKKVHIFSIFSCKMM